MKYAFLILAGVLTSASVPAQDVPQGPSPLAIGVYEAVTNTVPADGEPAQKSAPLTVTKPEAETSAGSQPGFNLQNKSAEELPLMPAVYETSGGAAPPAQPAGSSNQNNIVRASFLADTGVQYANAGEYQEAERAYLRALENSPGNPNIRFSLSTLYIQMERYKEAAGILNGMAAEFPENALVHNNLAWIYSTGGAMKNGKLAVRHAREAILSAPIESSMWNTLAEAYYVSGQYDRALRASEYAIDLLKMQNASAEGIAEFEKQHAKILRADEVSKKMLKPDSEE